MKRPAGVTTLAVLAMFAGVVQLIASLGYFGVSLVTTPLLFGTVASEVPFLVMGFGFVSLIVGVGAIVIGIGALSLRPLAWSTGMGLFIATLVIGALQLINGGIAVYGGLTVLLSAVVLGLLFSRSVREAFDVEAGDKFTTQHPSAA